MHVAAERDAERLTLGERPVAACAAGKALDESRAAAMFKAGRDTAASTNVLAGARSPRQTPNEMRAAAAKAAAAAAATAAAEVAAEECVFACMRLFHGAWLARAGPAVDARGLCTLSGAVQWIVRAAFPPVLAGVPDVSDPETRASLHAFTPLAASAALAPPPPLLAEPCQLPLLRTQRAAVELLVSIVLRSAQLPICAALIERMGVARAAVDNLQRQQHELAAALERLTTVPRLFLQEYDASRERRLSLWSALLDAPGEEVGLQLGAANAVDRLILTGALPFTSSFQLPLLKLPASFVPHHNGMALRHEGLLMLAALLARRNEQPKLFEQLLNALQRDRCVQREVARLAPALAAGGGSSRGSRSGGSSSRGERDERLHASVVTLCLMLDAARDLRLWQLLQEADAARTIHAVHLTFPEAPAVPLEKLLEVGPQGVQRPLGRAAATFVEGLREYERTTQRIHPLMTGAMRGGV